MSCKCATKKWCELKVAEQQWTESCNGISFPPILTFSVHLILCWIVVSQSFLYTYNTLCSLIHCSECDKDGDALAGMFRIYLESHRWFKLAMSRFTFEIEQQLRKKHTQNVAPRIIRLKYLSFVLKVFVRIIRNKYNTAVATCLSFFHSLSLYLFLCFNVFIPFVATLTGRNSSRHVQMNSRRAYKIRHSFVRGSILSLIRFWENTIASYISHTHTIDLHHFINVNMFYATEAKAFVLYTKSVVTTKINIKHINVRMMD